MCLCVTLAISILLGCFTDYGAYLGGDEWLCFFHVTNLFWMCFPRCFKRCCRNDWKHAVCTETTMLVIYEKCLVLRLCSGSAHKGCRLSRMCKYVRWEVEVERERTSRQSVLVRPDRVGWGFCVRLKVPGKIALVALKIFSFVLVGWEMNALALQRGRICLVSCNVWFCHYYNSQ